MIRTKIGSTVEATVDRPGSLLNNYAKELKEMKSDVKDLASRLAASLFVGWIGGSQRAEKSRRHTRLTRLDSTRLTLDEGHGI